MSVAAVIETHGLGKKFGGAQVLQPTTLRVPRGAVLALVGHNGAGKSTLIKLLLNMIPATDGSATVLGVPVERLRGEAFERIGYLCENQEMPEWMTVAGLMEHLRSLYPRWDDEGLLEEMQLPPERKIKHLSRGMRMKLALASVLAFGPELLLMDEPFSGLDTSVRTELVRAVLGRMRTDEDSATTMVISSHDLEEMETFATHVAFLREGSLLLMDSLEGLMARCREVTVTFGGNVAESAAARLAEGCVGAEAEGAMLRFVDMHANVQDHEGAMREVWPDAAHVESEPVSLRTIFLALNRPERFRARGGR
jgi:ABC-2 type transport system ATP-binding protein